MTALQFLAEWALRSSILILSGALLLWLLRVKDPSVRLAAWIAVLAGSLAIPALTAALPEMPLAVMRSAAPLARWPGHAADGASGVRLKRGRPESDSWRRGAVRHGRTPPLSYMD